MKINENQLNDIAYLSKSKNETTHRTIIPTYIPPDNIKAIDVTELSSSERLEMLELTLQYKEYQETVRAGMFNFETWAEHVKNKPITPKWRSFAINRITPHK